MRVPKPQYKTVGHINLYSFSDLSELVTQATTDRYVEFDGIVPPTRSFQVKLLDDSYCGWVDVKDWPKLTPAESIYVPPRFTRERVLELMPDIIAFTHAAMATPHKYLWGGTLGPDYDCSGLTQAAYRSVGIYLPRDAFEQDEFLIPVKTTLEKLEPGDLIFFGPRFREFKATHVGLYLGNGEYIHSSGPEHGRNGIGIDRIFFDESDETVHPVSRHYAATLRPTSGRCTQSFQP